MCLSNNYWQYLYRTLFSLGEMLVLSLFVISHLIIFKKFKKTTKRAVLSVVSIVISGFIALVILIAFFIYDIGADDPLVSQYSQLNAAVKNTCYLDPQKIHCPKNLSELISIQDKDFKKYLTTAHLFYEYRPETNQYTLIALEKGGKRGVIYDPRFEGRKDYGYGGDFSEITYNSCSGKIEINYLPPFDGLWNHLEQK